MIPLFLYKVHGLTVLVTAHQRKVLLLMSISDTPKIVKIIF